MIRDSLHVVRRVDGTWQVERGNVRLPLSLHREREGALDAALETARRERCGLVLHNRPRPRATWLDRMAWRLIDSESVVARAVQRFGPGRRRSAC